MINTITNHKSGKTLSSPSISILFCSYFFIYFFTLLLFLLIFFFQRKINYEYIIPIYLFIQGLVLLFFDNKFKTFQNMNFDLFIKGTFKGFIYSVIYYLIIGIVIAFFLNFNNNISEDIQLNINKFDFSLTFIISGLIFGPILEEIFYRRYLYITLRKKFKFIPTIIINSFFFALAHPKKILWFLNAFVFSLISCYLFEKNKNLFLNISFHVFINGILFLLYYSLSLVKL